MIDLCASPNKRDREAHYDSFRPPFVYDCYCCRRRGSQYCRGKGMHKKLRLGTMGGCHCTLATIVAVPSASFAASKAKNSHRDVTKCEG
jgi:hypothetical protein